MDAAHISAIDSSGLFYVSHSAIISCGRGSDIEGIWNTVQGILHPLSCEVVGHGSGFKALEAWVLDLIEPVIVEDWYERRMIGENSEMWEASEK